MAKTPQILGGSPKEGSHGLRALPFPDYVDSLAFTTVESFTVPARAHFMLIAVNVLTYMMKTDNAAVISTDIATGLAPMIINPGPPQLYACEPGDVYTVVSAGSNISIGYYGK